MAVPTTERITLAEAAGRVEHALDLGRLTAQHAPAGHPIHQAIADGEEAAAELRDLIPLWSSGGDVITPGGRVWQIMERVINAIYDAAATVRTPDGVELAPTRWPTPRALPWPWIAAGVGGLLLVAVLFQRRRA